MSFYLESLTSGAVSGTGTVRTTAKNLGSVVITTDGTNQAVIVIRDNDVSGDIILEITTSASGQVFGPIPVTGNNIYYSVSGTGAKAQFYQLVSSFL